MKYLLFYIDGFIKKFPLDKPTISIGRTTENDLVIKQDSISRKHVKITVNGDTLYIKDLDSTNGLFIKGRRVSQVVLRIGDAFSLGEMEFVVKKGSLDEFKLEKELVPIFDELSKDRKKDREASQTRYIRDMFSELLKEIIQQGLKKENFADLLMDMNHYMSVLTDFGSCFIIARQEKDFSILLSVKGETGALDHLKQVARTYKNIFTQALSRCPVGKSDSHFYSYPFQAGEEQAALVFITVGKQEREPRLEKFLSSLSKEIVLLSQLLGGRKLRSAPQKTADPESESDIIAASSVMKDLVQQARKIARSDIFVLIQGESGTGKELFAKLIHRCSSRKDKEIVAINCAAIPENLLESELFGYDKGAFTGAFGQKKGKLELASGSTLILDEIGDMPMNLQAKLLRALQEKEFYRLGGSTPIVVDLRIISITNQDLKKMIKEGKFREDLYYRLVHRTLHIPPLRERREDISALINYFTKKFCKACQKNIKGYSVKAFEMMTRYDWQGNIRQLENEINSIVNLTDNGEVIGHDILSDEIREPAAPTTAEEPPLSPAVMSKEKEKAYILELLEKNDWNKSQTARALNMTYRGLHKKMQRLGIDSPPRH